MQQDSNNAQPTVFLRKSSGLVKAAGLWDVFIYNVGLISVGIGVAYTQRFGPAYYPGSDIVTATVLAGVLMAFVVLAFWCWTTTIPRSGGIYVFLTRAQQPAFGFALSFVECISWLFYVAIAATLMSTVGIVPLVALLQGPDSTLTQWLASRSGQLVVATTIIWLAAILLVSGTRTYLRVQRVLFAIALLGTIALFFVIGSADAASTFRVNVDALFAGTASDGYDRVLSDAQSAGWEHSTTHTLAGSIPLLVWPFLPLIGSAFSIALGGEIRKTSRSQFLGMMGSLLACTLVFILVALFGDRSIGTSFQGAVGFTFDNATSDTPLLSTAIEPYFPYLAGLATDSTILRVLIPLGFLCWVFFWIPGVLAYTERAFLAWSLDRVAPPQLAALHPRFGTPYLAVVAGAVVAQVFLVLILYTDFFATLVFILAAAAAWCITLLLGVLFPYTVPRIFDSSPLAQWRSTGAALMSVCCLLGAAALGCVVYLLWNDPIAAGHDPRSLTAVGVTFATGFAFYFVMRAVRKRQGIDISRAYKEIPVE